MVTIRRLALTTAVFFLSAALASAQQTTQQQPSTAGKTPAAAATTAPATQAITDTISVPTNPVKEVVLKTGKAIEAAFGFGDIDGIPTSLTTGVTAKGFARQVSAEGQNVNQVLINAVSKGEKTEAITQGLTAQIDVPAGSTGNLSPSSTVVTEGSKAALLAALKKLAEQDKKDSQQTSSDTKEFSIGGNSPSNPLASQYQVPTTSNTTTPSTSTSTSGQVTAQVTTQGCGMRIDLSQGRVFQQNKTQILTNGSVSQDGTCADSNVSFPIQRDYTTCSDQVDTGAMKAYPQYKNYYVDSNGTTNYIDQSCQPDQSKYYAITQNYDACSMSVDLTGGSVYRQAELVYINANNSQVVVQGCQRTNDAPIPLTKSAASCPPRLDLTAMLAYEQQKSTYQWNGTTITAQDCTDDGISFPITENRTVCAPLVDQTSGMAYPQHRYQYVDGTGMTQWADTGCAPITGLGSKLQSTTDGCTAAANYIPYISAGYTDGSSRTYYTAFDGSNARVYVTACQEDPTIQFQNQRETTGWQNDDTKLSAQPITDVYINGPNGKLVVSSPAVADGAPTITYTLTGQQDVPNGQHAEIGCNDYQNTTTSRTYTRPNGSTYNYALGAGTPVGPTNVCVTSVVGMAQVVVGRYLSSVIVYSTGTACNSDECWMTSGSDYVFYWGLLLQYQSKLETKNTINGDIIGDSCLLNGSYTAGTKQQQGIGATGTMSNNGNNWTANGLSIPFGTTGESDQQDLFDPTCGF